MEDDAKKRGEAFFKEYGELVEKHQVDFANYPMFIPDKDGSFKIIIQSTPVDVKNRPKPSPFIAK